MTIHCNDDDDQDENEGAEIIDLQVTRLQITMRTVITMKSGEKMPLTATSHYSRSYLCKVRNRP